MTTQAKTFTPVLKPFLDGFMVALSILAGGLITLLGLWLWRDYQVNPAASLLVLVSQAGVSLLPPPVQTFLSQEARSMGLPLAGDTPAFWYMARAGGLVAYLLLWLSMLWGLVLSTKVTEGLVAAPIAYGLHEFLSLGAVVFAGLHSLVLLGDRYINFSLLHLLLPFTAPYEPLWTGLGTIGFYLVAALTASFYLRKQIGQKLWRLFHYLSFGAYGLALLHSLMAGTDSSLGLVKLIYLGTGFTILFLTLYRLLTVKVKEPKLQR